MITAYKWYCIARSNTIGSSAGVKIDIKHFRILAHVSVDWGNVVLTVQETNLTEDITGSLRLRKNGNSWYLDVKISQSYKEESIEVSLYDNDHYDWYSYTDNELSGSTICLIEDVASVVAVQNADNLWAVNADGDLYPKDKEDGTPRNIISYGGISFGGNSSAGGGGGGEEEGEGGTIGSLSNVSPSADAISEQTQILVKDSNSLEYVPRNIDEIAGFNEDKLAEYLLAHKYVTEDYLHGLIFPDPENNAVRTALNLVVEGGVSFGGVSSAGGEGGGGTIKYPLTWSGYSSGSFDGSVSANIVIPTTLPANDVYTWAKQPSLLLSDIPDLSSKYLPLSGGTMQGNLDFGKNSITNAKELSCYDSGTGYYVGGRNYGLGVTDGGLLLYSYGDTPISLYTYGTEKMRITSGGNVLIGDTTDNGNRLQVQGAISLTTALRMTFNNNSTCGLYPDSWISGADASRLWLYNVGKVAICGEQGVEIHSDLTTYGSISLTNELYCNGWLRSYGDRGWYSETYGGGIHMTDTNFVRTYDNKAFSASYYQMNYTNAVDITSSGNWYRVWEGDYYGSIILSLTHSWSKNQTDNLIFSISTGYQYGASSGITLLSRNIGTTTYQAIRVVYDGDIGKHCVEVFIGPSGSNFHWVSGIGHGVFLQPTLVTSTNLSQRCMMQIDHTATIQSSNNAVINGNISASGEVTFGSDARYKDKIKDTSISLRSIAEAPLFTYRWNDRDDDRVYLGTTAQYWLDTPFKCAVNTTNPDFLGLGYGELGVAIGIVNSRKLLNHESRITTLERDKEKERLKKQLKKLQYQFRQLEKQLQQYRRALQ